jgi:hypothetical protein
MAKMMAQARFHEAAVESDDDRNKRPRRKRWVLSACLR